MMLEVDKGEQSGPVSFGAENQFIFFSVKSQLKGRGSESQFQYFAAFFYQFFVAFLQGIGIHNHSKFSLNLGKGSPGFFRFFTEVCLKQRQSQPAAAVVNQGLSILVIWAGSQCLFKIFQGKAFLIQVIVGVAHAEIPTVVALEIVLMRF